MRGFFMLVLNVYSACIAQKLLLTLRFPLHINEENFTRSP